MNVFRIQEQVPDVYARKSRDFQLLCNIYDCVQGAVKYDIDSIRDLTTTDLCSQRMLNYLQTKLGFFTDVKMNSDTQRTILKAFPYLIRNKGSRKGIEQAIQVFLKTQHASGEIKVTVTNKQTVNGIEDRLNIVENVYTVQVAMSTKLLDITILDEILKYIIPAGYKIQYLFYNPLKLDNIVIEEDAINIIFVENALHSGIRITGNNDVGNLPINAVSTTRIVDNDTSILPTLISTDRPLSEVLSINRATNIKDVNIDNQTQYTNKEVT